MSSGNAILSTLKHRYIRERLVEIIVLVVFSATISFSILSIFSVTPVKQVILTALLSIAIFLFRFFQLGLNKVSSKSIASFLNSQYAQFHGSMDLVLTPEQELSPLGKLQQIKTLKTIESLNKEIRFPNQIRTFLILATVGIISFLAVRTTGFTINSSNFIEGINNNAIQENTIPENLPAEITEAKVTITPPAYTSLQRYSGSALNLKVQEGSNVLWSLKFSSAIHHAALKSSSRDTIWFTQQNNSWQLTSTVERSGFYQFIWRDETSHTSHYYKIDVIKDQAPVIRLTNLEQFTQVDFDSKQTIDANPVITDDYGLTDAYIIATVSKGSGESVKFREEKIKFSTPQKIAGKHVNARQSLDLKKLGLEPGDELYFYVEAFDNKAPQPNKSRTETYFITIPDTAQDVMAAGGGLGVDLMPEYFRSQRQIIIDTEKLLREKKTITKKEFNSRSNELGYDQKVLRLRYGQFLGEEEDSGIASAATHVEAHTENEKPEDMIKEFGHQHDTENEHNLVEEKNPAKKDAEGAKKEDPFAEFVHQHDTEESSTFFFQSLKVKLKAALTQMWDAELHLRLYEPEKSLPYQYTALKLLKEISNDSRIYVHRTGFEPPPIKEEKRLSADLNDIFNSTWDYDAAKKKYFPAISAALSVTEKLLTQQTPALSQKDKNSLLQSGSELAQAALENPALLEGLSALQAVTAGQLKPETLIILRKAYWLALPQQPAPAGKNNSVVHELDNKLIEQLEVLEP